MPDLPNRARFERELTEALSEALSKAQRTLARELWHEGMTQAELANAPQSVLRDVRNDVQRVLQEALPLAFIEAANNFASEMGYGLDEDALAEAAATWGTEYAATLARQLVERRQIRLREIAQRAPDVELERKDLLALLLLALSLGGVAAIAITELSGAASRGEEFVQKQLESQSIEVERVWYTQEDERVCPVCEPRHGRKEGNGWSLPPPAHPRCRCYLGYRITSADGTVRILFDDDEIAKTL